MSENGESFREFVRTNPEEALRLLKKLKPNVVVPHPGQRVVVDSTARYKVLNCGRRWGKTKIGCKVLIDQANSAPEGSVLWWVAPTYKIVKRGYRELLRQLPPGLLTHSPPPDTNFDAGRSVILKFKNGTQIEFYSAERPEGMLGEGVHFAVLDEAATMPSRIWEQIVRPTLMDKKGGGLLISTPRGRNWFYKRWLMGQDPQEPDWSSWTFTSYDNPYVEDSEVQAMKKELPRVMFEQEAMAQFIADGSAVFQWPHQFIQTNMVFENGMVEDMSPKGSTVFLGIDLAKTSDFTVLYGARENDRRNVYFERFHDVRWKEQKRRIKRAVAKLMHDGADNVTLVMDSTGLGDPIVEDMEDMGFDVIGINFSTFKTKMVTALAKDLEVGKAFLLEDAGLVEFENYAMSTTPSGRITYSAPEGEHDDIVSAKMLSHWGMASVGAPNVEGIGADGEIDLSAELNPWDLPDDQAVEEWSDLIDNDEEVMESIGFEQPDPHARPTPEELLVRGWY